MGKKELWIERMVFVTKCMLAAYVLTAGLLLLLAQLCGIFYPDAVLYDDNSLSHCAAG